jgi:hypothetical protein
MKPAARIATFAATVLFSGGAAAAAQTVSVMECRPALGVTAGVSENGDQATEGPRRVLDTSASFEMPVSDRLSVRADGGSARWEYKTYDPTGTPLGADRIRINRATVTAIKRSPHPCGSPFRMFAGLGFGGYRYRFPDHTAAVKSGVHGLAGLDVAAGERLMITAEMSIHAVGGPARPPLNPSTLLFLRATVGVRVLY